MANHIKKVIPFFRELLNESGLELTSILHANSFYRSDMSLIKNDGLELDGRVRDSNVATFDIIINKNVMSENNTSYYLATIDIDIYGEDANDIALKFITKVLDDKTLYKFRKNKIGINPDIDINNMYETIHGVQWLRSHLEIKFMYYYEVEKDAYEDDNYINKYQANIMKGN